MRAGRRLSLILCLDRRNGLRSFGADAAMADRSGRLRRAAGAAGAGRAANGSDDTARNADGAGRIRGGPGGPARGAAPSGAPARVWRAGPARVS